MLQVQEWLKANDDKVHEIGKAGRQLAMEVLTFMGGSAWWDVSHNLILQGFRIVARQWVKYPPPPTQVLTRDARLCFWKTLIEEYARMQTYRPR